jgi:hypothetical protein
VGAGRVRAAGVRAAGVRADGQRAAGVRADGQRAAGVRADGLRPACGRAAYVRPGFPNYPTGYGRSAMTGARRLRAAEAVSALMRFNS